MSLSYTPCAFHFSYCYFPIFPPDLNLPTIPEVDLAFAISAASVEADDNFEKAKEVINAIVDTYSMNKLHYGVVVFGSRASTQISFEDVFPSDENLKAFIRGLSGPNGFPALDEALKKGKEMFGNAKERPNARKVLVVIMDKKSTSELDDLKDSAKLLEEDGIKVIPVAIGDEVDHAELKATTAEKTNMVNASTDVDLTDLKTWIMNKVFKGKCNMEGGHFFLSSY